MSKLLNYAKNISGTNAYWNQKKQNLQSIIEQKGPPTIFWTLSCADFHWPEFHSLFGENLQSSNFRSNVLNNPHIFDWLFTERVKSFVKWWLYKTLGAEWHWYRYEFAVQRGSIHCHGVAKLQDDPGLCKLTQIALKGFLAKQKKNGQVTNSGEVTIEQLQQQIDEGLQAEKVICCYTDSLLSTWNNNNPEEMQWIKPDVHPCKQRFSDITEQHLDDDYEDLLNTVQRHTICNSLYCLKRRNDEKLQCRFDFPVRQCEYTHLEFESVNTKDKSIRYRAKVVTARNDTRLNRHQRIQLQGWRANCDINVVIDYHACIEYLAKYTSKGEKISNVARDAFISVVRSIKSTSDSGNTSKKIKQLMMKAVGQRDMSIQEVMHQTLSLNLFSSSFEVVSVSFDGIRRLTNEDGEVVTHTSLLDNYAFRKNFINDEPAIVSLNFIQFTSKFVVKNERLHKRKSDVVVQTFPRYSSSPQSSNYGLYCKYQLLKYKPWSNTLSSAWNNEDDTNEVFVTHWNNFLHTPNIHCYVPEWNRELTNICTYFQNSDDDEQFHENNEAAEPEEWMLLSNHHSSTEASSQYFSVNSETDFEYWQQGQKSYSQEEIGNMPSWIDSQKQINNLAEATANVFSDFDVGSLNDEQSKAANREKRSCQLNGKALQKLQDDLEGVHYLLIDEYSVIGQKMFGWISKRLKQATGNNEKPFGGISIILVGDIAQLPPVIDKPLYNMLPGGEVATEGCCVYFSFDNVIKLITNQRAAGTGESQKQLRDLLLHLRDGNISQDQWKILLTRTPSKVDNLSVFKDTAIKLAFGNKSVAENNYDSLIRLSVPIARINAKHNNVSASKQPADDMGGLQPTLLLSKGAMVMLTRNLWTEVGLCNGAIGVVYDIIYQTEQGPPNLPISVLVQFHDNYIGPSFSSTVSNLVPISAVTSISDSFGPSYERQQLPLRLSWSITIHKSQGLTLNKVWIDLGKKETCPGLTYVALSRIRSINDLVIESMTLERLQAVRIYFQNFQTIFKRI
ncbi:LOW QUALITY PROTEIN: uncharacterized protein LOC135688681 [Rhopilema esculentum]|uniref:LOW QUALITY PROTEIN: uncharacterized protein LOC135688681 n=1 Tax=Rhopilema esculentum TaxID=499914 RepID=UPI0031D518BC